MTPAERRRMFGGKSSGPVKLAAASDAFDLMAWTDEDVIVRELWLSDADRLLAALPSVKLMMVWEE